ncbi:PH domain-containing protein [Candidatus Nomurabacteria bacterium]|jgi:membrane protein YdbS with pleckstrin-like domain|nr:PH domain-containing protein [Candidatus Saccharibacteria bacterium]MCA9350541.1 PH domain-containing protein [Candidatus Saccharibacteria bacterium]MCB9839413.1 PH domain-containing protein [Candidatus Nomurabacteria bacterium]
MDRDKIFFRSKIRNRSKLRKEEHLADDEHIIAIAYQHPVGIIVMYVAAFACFVVAMFIISSLLPSVFNDSATAYGLVTFFALIAAVILGIILAVGTFVYKQSSLTVTDRNVIQVLQQGIFNRKISQISLANVEDVTSHQKGFFANAFNFGVIKIETAGEQANFNFTYCPDCNKMSKVILDAKDEFLIATGQAGSYRNNVKPGHMMPPEKDDKDNNDQKNEQEVPNNVQSDHKDRELSDITDKINNSYRNSQASLGHLVVTEKDYRAHL